MKYVVTYLPKICTQKLHCLLLEELKELKITPFGPLICLEVQLSIYNQWSKGNKLWIYHTVECSKLCTEK